MRPAALPLAMAMTLGTGCGCAIAADAGHAETRIAVTGATERLSNDTPDWREATVRIQRQFAPRHGAALALTRTERFGLEDRQIGAEYTLPLGAALVLSAEANVSDTHRVLARHALGGALQYEFAPAWLLHAGLRTTRYDAVRVNQPLLMLEHYAGSFSWAAGWRPTRAFGTTAHNGELRASYYYGDTGSIGLIVAAGKEAASIGQAVVLDDMRAATVVGRHPLARDWTLHYSVGHTRQGDFYTRNGISLGLQHVF